MIKILARRAALGPPALSWPARKRPFYLTGRNRLARPWPARGPAHGRAAGGPARCGPLNKRAAYGRAMKGPMARGRPAGPVFWSFCVRTYYDLYLNYNFNYRIWLKMHKYMLG